jgi:hypothetical protein
MKILKWIGIIALVLLCLVFVGVMTAVLVGELEEEEGFMKSNTRIVLAEGRPCTS